MRPAAPWSSRLLALILAAAAGGDLPSAAEVTATEVTAREVAGARIVQAVLPGRPLAAVLVEGAGVAILLAPENQPEGPRSLYRFDPAGDGSLTRLAQALPTDLDSVAALELDGRQEVVAGAPGVIYAFGRLDDDDIGRVPRLMLEAPGIDLAMLRRHRLIAADRAFVPRPRLGRLDVHPWGDPAGGTAAASPSTFELPYSVRRARSGLVLSIPRVSLLERPGELPLIAAGPEPLGKRRLLTTLIDPAGDPAGRETWARLPANERIVGRWYLTLDGRPALAVAALSADKMGVPEKLKLRVFLLRSDRTRAGSPPTLAIDTVTRHWYRLGVQVTDFDRDGRDDLAVLQPDGLGAKKLAIEIYRGRDGGGFHATPRRSVVVAPEARWLYGEDFGGDGVADLAATTGGRLLIFRGVGPAKKKGVIEKTPLRSFDADLGFPDPEIVVRVGGGGNEDDSDSDSDSEVFLGRPRFADLDGDGRGEILLIGEIGDLGVVRVVALPGIEIPG